MRGYSSIRLRQDDKPWMIRPTGLGRDSKHRGARPESLLIQRIMKTGIYVIRQIGNSTNRDSADFHNTD